MHSWKNKDVQEAITKAITDTLADMAFLDVIPADKSSVDYKSILLIRLEVPVHGAIALFLPLDLKKSIAENINGISWEEMNIDVIDDCLLELLNIIAGLFLSNLFGDETKSNLSFPQVVFDDAEIDLKEYLVYAFNAEEHYFKVAVKLDKGK